MQEIAQFREELTEVISRYQSKIPKRQLISTVSSVLCKQLNIIKASVKWKENPVIRGVGYAKGFPIIDEIVNSGPSFLEQHALKGEFKCTD